jgi:hypothetical protein
VGGGGGIRTRGGRVPPIAFEAIPLWPLRYPTSRRVYEGAAYAPGLRSSKNERSNAAHSSSRTPGTTSTRWLSLGSCGTL